MVVSPGGALPDSIRPPAPSEGQSWDLNCCWLLRSELVLFTRGNFLLIPPNPRTHAKVGDGENSELRNAS
jgi:hypothetical protein